MKKIYFSLIAIAILLFAACNNSDVPGNEKATEVGTLTATISFEKETVKAASSTAIPTVSWDNVKQVQLFLYDPSGAVVFSRTVKPTTTNQTFSWDNVPIGSYRLALLANVKSSTDNMVTSVEGATVEFTDANVIGNAFSLTNPSLQIDLKPATLPTLPQWNVTPANNRVGYAVPSEIFTAYKDISIAAGNVTIVPDPAVPGEKFELKREISMLRARFNIKEHPDYPALTYGPTFNDNADNFIAIQRLPVGFGMSVGSFEGGILGASDEKRVMVCATGTGTYKTPNDPLIGYQSGGIIFTPNDDFTMYNDIHVLPNVSAAEITQYTIVKDDDIPDAIKDRKYFIIFSARVEAGYEYADGKIASDPSPVYWFGTIDGVFTKNVIREVNLTLTTAGYPDIPDGPGSFGGLEITISTPENWDTIIVESNKNV